MYCLVFTDTDLYSLTKGKAYLANQRWRRSTCLRDQCYDVGCHPWYSTVFLDFDFVTQTFDLVTRNFDIVPRNLDKVT